jgi:DNA primase
MSSSSVDQIKAKLDIVSVVGTYIKLEKTGSNFKGKCPFHNEKTPSFFISPDRGSYYCFGCHAKGDIFSFIQEFEGLDFVGALKVLADRAGVTLEKYDSLYKTATDALYHALELATFYFEKNLSHEQVPFDYLLHRGVSKESVSTWRLGYAYPEWRGLYDFLLSKQVLPETMLATGLVKRKEGTTDTYYDTFRGRIMFPIADTSGRVVGFSGRILVDDGKSPKYLNSPETELFNKSEILYGLDKAKSDIRNRKYTILVEGQMDMVMLHQTGFSNTVASSGTALSEGHLTRLSRLSSNIIFAFDGDKAGISAVSRASKIALSLGMEVKVARMPEGTDPADIAQKDPQVLSQCIAGALHVIMFVLEHILEQTTDQQLVSRAIVSDVLPFVASLSSASEQSYFIGQISARTRIKEDALWSDVRRVVLMSHKVIPQTDMVQTKQQTDRRETIVRKLIGIMWWQQHVSEKKVNDFDLEKKLIDVLGTDLHELYIQKNISNREALLFETEAYYNNRDTLGSDVSDLLHSLEEEDLKTKLLETMTQLHTAESMHDTVGSLELLKKCQQLSQRINELKKIYEKK